MASPNLTAAIEQYPVLHALAAQISALDLFNLALSSKAHHGIIAASPEVFRRLRVSSLCDGRGLRIRQDQVRLYTLGSTRYHWGRGRRITEDEPIEVRLYATKCDPASALPCIKCGVNVCEECRYYPRELPANDRIGRRPHLNGAWQLENVMALCPPCDEKQEAEIARPENFPATRLCNCDVYTRWICHKCKVAEEVFTREYFEACTVHDPDFVWPDEEAEEDKTDELGNDFQGRTMVVQDHQHMRGLYCLCGAAVPDNTVLRCTWCKRRHRPESEWGKEMDEIYSKFS